MNPKCSQNVLAPGAVQRNVMRIKAESLDHEFERDKMFPEWHGWHAARRGLGTNLYRLGLPEKTIQAILRHANVSTTKHVLHQERSRWFDLREIDRKGGRTLVILLVAGEKSTQRSAIQTAKAYWRSAKTAGKGLWEFGLMECPSDRCRKRMLSWAEHLPD